MGLESLKKGDMLQLSDGSTVEVAGPAEGDVVPVIVVDAPFGSEKPGDRKKVDADDIYGVYADSSLSSIRAI